MWHFLRAKQRAGTVFILLSSRAVGDEDNPQRSDADTQVVSFSKASAAQTTPQFVAMVKKEVGVLLASLNAAVAETDVSAQFSV